LRNPISGKLRLHSNTKRKCNSNVNFFYTFGLISQVGHRASNATNSVIAATRKPSAFYVMSKQRSGRWTEGRKLV
jgi:hypothetical protein